MAAKAQPLEVGQKFGRWVVVSDPKIKSQALCKCDCGKQKMVLRASLRNGSSKSCGCRVGMPKRVAWNKTHGKSRTPEAATWLSMIARCENTEHPQFRLYGARGIAVCKEWQLFENFFTDMGCRPKGFTLDRIDNNKGYSKENCKWASHSENCQNKRNSRRWFVNGVMYEGLQQASVDIGLSGATLRGWCLGHKTNGRWYPPKENCWSEMKYETSVVCAEALS